MRPCVIVSCMRCARALLGAELRMGQMVTWAPGWAFCAATLQLWARCLVPILGQPDTTSKPANSRNHPFSSAPPRRLSPIALPPRPARLASLSSPRRRALFPAAAAPPPRSQVSLSILPLPIPSLPLLSPPLLRAPLRSVPASVRSRSPGQRLTGFIPIRAAPRLPRPWPLRLPAYMLHRALRIGFSMLLESNA